MKTLFTYSLLALSIFCNISEASISFNENVHQLQESSAVCLLDLANKHFEEYSTVALVKSLRQYWTNLTLGISTEDLWMQRLVNKESWAIMMKFINPDDPRKEFQFGFEKVHNYVIVFQNDIDLKKALEELSLENSWNPHAKFMGYLIGFPGDELVNLVMRLFWKFWVMNVVIFIPKKEINGHHVGGYLQIIAWLSY